MLKHTLTVAALLVAFLGTHAQAQTIPVTANSGISFTVSLDPVSGHTATLPDGSPVVLNYLMRFASAVGATCPPMGPATIGKPTPDAAGTIAVKPFPVLGALPPNCLYTATVAAVGPTGLEGVSDPSTPFWRAAPPTPAKPGPPLLLP